MVLSPAARMALLAFLAALLLFGLFSEPPFGVDASDLSFAQSAAPGLFGLADAANLLSAVGILAASLFGWWAVRKTSRKGYIWEVGAKENWSAFFAWCGAAALAAVVLHASPGLTPFFVARLLALLAITALWNTLMIERVDAEIGRRCVPWFNLVAVIAVAYWAWTESLGQGDLRLYQACMLYPLMVLPMLLSLFPLEAGGGGWLFFGWLVYLIAKFFEVIDLPIFQQTQELISGHTLSHIGQALAIVLVAQSLLARRPDRI
jgi:hypothetical protein